MTKIQNKAKLWLCQMGNFDAQFAYNFKNFV